MERSNSQKLPLAQAAGTDSGYTPPNQPLRKNRYTLGLEQRIATLTANNARLEGELADALRGIVSEQVKRGEVLERAEKAEAKCTRLAAAIRVCVERKKEAVRDAGFWFAKNKQAESKPQAGEGE